MTRFARAAARRTFKSLGVRNYRLYFFGMMISASGTWMQMVAQGWLVLRLTDRPSAVGLVTALQFLPMLLFGMWGGLVADRFDKRRVLMITQAWMSGVTGILAVVTLTGHVEVWMVYASALLIGVATVVDNPTRQSFVIEMVGPDEVANAVALNSAMFNSARIVGPSIAGVLILAGGTGTAFAYNSISYLAVIGGLMLMRTSELQPAEPAAKGRGQVRAGLRYVWRTPELRSTVLLVAAIGTFALNYQVLLPVLAKFTFASGPGTFGVMMSAMGVGSLVGALTTAGRARPTPVVLVGAGGALGLLQLSVAAAPVLPVAIGALVLCGTVTTMFLATANATCQVTAAPEMRGRVMAIYLLVFLGSTPIGGPIAGWVAEQFGARAGFAMGGVVATVVAIWTGVELHGRYRRAALSPQATEQTFASIGG